MIDTPRELWEIKMLLDKYLPKFTFREYHQRILQASAEQAFGAAKNVDLGRSKTIKLLFRLRGLPTQDMTLKGFVERINFTWLEEIENRELIIGFWANTRIEKILEKEQFARDNQSRRVKVVWNIKIDDRQNGSVVVSTETRVYCSAGLTKIFFGLYWAMIRPFSGLIRIKMLELIKASVQASVFSGTV